MPGASGDAPDGAAPLSLSGPERSVLAVLRASTDLPIDENDLAAEMGLGLDAVRGSLQRLKSKRLAELTEEHATVRSLTPRGERAVADGLPERRFLEALVRHGGALAPESAGAAELAEDERRAAIGILRRRGLLADGLPFRVRDGVSASSASFPEELVLKQLANGEDDLDPPIVESLERRGLVRTERRSIKRWAPSEEGRRLVLDAAGSEALGAVTTGLLTTGGWKGKEFRPYDVRAPVPWVTAPRPNPYVAWLEEFAELLVGLGFVEAEGPLLETEFWNNDVLFMPQDHPARSIHDALGVAGVSGRPPPADLLAGVAAVHEGRPPPGATVPVGPGWGGGYDPSVAARPVLRSQTTAVSARCLARGPSPPFRFFTLDRNFRRESVDATHSIEFHQCEGIVGAEGTTLRDLVGMFSALAEGIGVRELKIRPSYFPFTEPSIEGYVRHPRLGWIEVFPGGMLRPEVLAPLGTPVPVAAWGIGIMRLALVGLGVSDIRDLFLDDYEKLGRGTP